MALTHSELRQQKANEGIADFEKWEGRRRFYSFPENNPAPPPLNWQLKYFFRGNREDAEGLALLAIAYHRERNGLPPLFSLL